jgi:hypothetical protein
MFASCYRLYGLELRADFQQYYGLCLDRMGRDFSLSHAADLAMMLPHYSRLFCALDPANAWGVREQLLANIANNLALLLWSKTEDARRGANMPKPIMPPGRRHSPAKARGRAKEPPSPNPAMASDEYMRILARPRTAEKGV